MTPNEKADATYQPNTVLTIHKRINSVFCQEGIQYSLHSDFEGMGGFRAFWKKRFEEALKYCSGIGSVPFCAHFDPDSNRKIRDNGNFRLYNDYNDCLALVYYYVTEAFSLRGRMEVSYLIEI